jgi:Uma2 family endonuclease
MSNTVRKPHLLTPDDYLAFDTNAEEKYEYVDGEIHAMTGTTVKHNRISLNLAVALKQHLAGQPCETFIADLKIHAAAANSFYYPDLVVRCQPQPLADSTRVIDDPTLIVEVLSPSTEATDRREKLAAYRRIPSVQEYVLVAQEERSVEIYRREGDIGWRYLPFTDDEPVEFASIGLTLPMAAIYGEA